MQRIISWNVASVRSRLSVLEKFLSQYQPNVMFLQEIKATEENFPYMDFSRMGYYAYISGQKSYNGVAILSKEPLSQIISELPNAPIVDPIQARFIQGQLKDGTVVISVYVPNGTAPAKDPSDTTRLEYKINWIDALAKHISMLVEQKKKVILGGDFNVIVRDTDVYNAKSFEGSALIVPSVRQAFERLSNVGLINQTRFFNPEEKTYTFWDFQMGAWPRNLGILLDFFFVSPDLKVEAAPIYKEIRGWEKTSDHAPIGLQLVS